MRLREMTYFVASALPERAVDDGTVKIDAVYFDSPFTDYVKAWIAAGQARKVRPQKIFIVIDESIANLLRP